MAKIHRLAGYFMLLLGNITVASGIGHYYSDKLLEDDRKVLAPISLLSFILLVLVLEAMFRARNKWSLGTVKTPETLPAGKMPTFTPAEIDMAVSSGRKFVIFDNLVLDLNGFERIHPGGKFNLLHNLGRDISKFFNGGYKLVNSSSKKPHTHSKAALDIVKTMIVGVLEGQSEVNDIKFRITRK